MAGQRRIGGRLQPGTCVWGQCLGSRAGRHAGLQASIVQHYVVMVIPSHTHPPAKQLALGLQPPLVCLPLRRSGECEGRFALKSNGSAYRRALFKLERGVCVSCKLDCHTLVKRLQAILRRRYQCCLPACLPLLPARGCLPPEMGD